MKSGLDLLMNKSITCGWQQIAAGARFIVKMLSKKQKGAKLNSVKITLVVTFPYCKDSFFDCEQLVQICRKNQHHMQAPALDY